MENTALSEREYLVLEALIQSHIAAGRPIGSATLSRGKHLGISPATIRHTLSQLEAKGYVCQPHTSAGRLPTDRGYRLYVEQYMASGALLPPRERAYLRRRVEVELCQGRVDEILGQLARIIGDISKQLGVVTAPRFEQGIFSRLELVQLENQRLLLVLSMRQGLVKSLEVEVDSRVSQRDLEAVSRLLNERLHGLSLAEIRRSAHRRLRSAGVGNPQLLRVVLAKIKALGSTGATELHIAGTRNICLQPEFRDPLTAAGLLDLVEKKEVLARMLVGREGVVVTIGDENEALAMRPCSLVTASYEVGGAAGVIGVIGPTRMPYARVVGLVHCAALRVAALVN